jgi:hypothetical protein
VSQRSECNGYAIKVQHGVERQGLKKEQLTYGYLDSVCSAHS